MSAWIESYLSEIDEDGYVPFNRDRRLGQNQYASRFVDGRLDSPDLGQGLRFRQDHGDYHSIRIHRDDLEEFHRRVAAFRKDCNEGRPKRASAYLSAPDA